MTLATRRKTEAAPTMRYHVRVTPRERIAHYSCRKTTMHVPDEHVRRDVRDMRDSLYDAMKKGAAFGYVGRYRR